MNPKDMAYYLKTGDVTMDMVDEKYATSYAYSLLSDSRMVRKLTKVSLWMTLNL